MYKFATLTTTMIKSLFVGLLLGIAVPLVADQPEWVAAEVRRVDLETSRVTLRHQEIKSLNMSGMTMVFSVRDPAMLEMIKEGDSVLFTVVRNEGRLVVTEIKRAPPEM